MFIKALKKRNKRAYTFIEIASIFTLITGFAATASIYVRQAMDGTTQSVVEEMASQSSVPLTYGSFTIQEQNQNTSNNGESTKGTTGTDIVTTENSNSETTGTNTWNSATAN